MISLVMPKRSRPKQVIVIDSLDVDDQSSVDSSAQLSAHAPVASSSAASQPVSFVTAEQFEAMNDKWTEQFGRFETLLSKGNMFTTPKSVFSSLPITTSTLISSQPFINPAAQHTGPVVSLAVQETLPKGGESKPIKKAHKSPKSDSVRDVDWVLVEGNIFRWGVLFSSTSLSVIYLKMIAKYCSFICLFYFLLFVI